MINQLRTLLDDFPGPANQTRCFLHILNITAKSIIKQFDVPTANNDTVVDKAAQALADLADGIDIEEREVYQRQDWDDDEVDDPPLDAWAELRDELTEEQRDEIDLRIEPVRSMLTKVISISGLWSLTNHCEQVAQAGIRTDKIDHHSPPTVV